MAPLAVPLFAEYPFGCSSRRHRMRGIAFHVVCLITALGLAEQLSAALDVNAARPITHRVTVQMIQTALTDGSSAATVFGNATQRASIEASVDTIWAQAGIDVLFLPTVNRWNNTFAYQGNGGSRGSNELGTIVTSGDAAGVTNSTSSVINQFFVNIVPGFSFTSENTANGIANLGRDGTAQFVGDGLLTFAGGREVIAGVVAHEIGHVLGLKHTADAQPNLMSPRGTTEQLSDAQIQAIFQTSLRNDSVASIPNGGTGFPRPFSPTPTLPGDYNGNGQVDAADYTVWRNTLGSRTSLSADGDGDGLIDQGDYVVWKNGYGNRTGSGSFTGSAIPEPASLVLFLAGLIAVRWRPRRRSACA
jgi:hypothetical protein